MGNALATGENLGKRGVSLQRCALCGYFLDSTLHLFFTCSFACKIWSKLCSPVSLFSHQMNSTLDLLSLVLVSWSVDDICRCCLILWSIWQAHNKFIFRIPVPSVDKVCM